MGCGQSVKAIRNGKAAGHKSDLAKSEKVMKSAILIQKWYRRYVARMERRWLYTWNIFQTIEYAEEQDQLRLYNLFNAMLTHLKPGGDSPECSNGEQTGTGYAKNEDPLENKKSSTLEAEEAELLKFTNPEKLSLGPAYDGPHLHFPLNLVQLHSVIDAFKKNQILHPKYLLQLLLEIRKLLKTMPNITHVSTFIPRQVTVCGDLHGKFTDLLLIFYKNGLPAADNPYIFNGDFVDRGQHSVEITIVLFACMLIHPRCVFLNRGNHEDYVMNLRYGFVKEIMNKYRVNATKIVRLFQDVFSWLPLATIIDSKILVCHGGLSDQTDLKFIATINRHKYISALRSQNPVQKPAEDQSDGGSLSSAEAEYFEWKQVLDLLWSDPKPQSGCQPNTFRGGGCYFGPDITNKFLKKHNLSLLIRSHQCKLEGYEYEHDNKVLTVFSASNYYEEGSNKGAYIKLMPDLEPHIVQYISRKHPSRKLTIRKRIGVVERSAFSNLIGKICASKTALLKEFNNFDPKSTGTIKVTDWCQTMRTVLRLDLPWLSLCRKLVPINKSGLVEYRKSFEDFKLEHLKSNKDGAMVTEALYRHKDSLETIFRVIDKDNSGQISMDEFEEACSILSQHTKSAIPKEQVLNMAHNIDLNKDGHIDFNEFLEAFRIVDQFGHDLFARRTSDEAADGAVNGGLPQQLDKLEPSGNNQPPPLKKRSSTTLPSDELDAPTKNYDSAPPNKAILNGFSQSNVISR